MRVSLCSHRGVCLRTVKRFVESNPRSKAGERVEHLHFQVSSTTVVHYLHRLGHQGIFARRKLLSRATDICYKLAWATDMIVWSLASWHDMIMAIAQSGIRLKPPTVDCETTVCQ